VLRRDGDRAVVDPRAPRRQLRAATRRRSGGHPTHPQESGAWCSLAPAGDESPVRGPVERMKSPISRLASCVRPDAAARRRTRPRCISVARETIGLASFPPSHARFSLFGRPCPPDQPVSPASSDVDAAAGAMLHVKPEGRPRSDDPTRRRAETDLQPAWLLRHPGLTSGARRHTTASSQAAERPSSRLVAEAIGGPTFASRRASRPCRRSARPGFWNSSSNPLISAAQSAASTVARSTAVRAAELPELRRLTVLGYSVDPEKGPEW
jgi:hypothetical protein